MGFFGPIAAGQDRGPLMSCPRLEAQIANLKKMYAHLGGDHFERMRKEHSCPECADPQPAHPPLPRDMD